MRAVWNVEKKVYQLEFDVKELEVILFGMTIAAYVTRDTDMHDLHKALRSLYSTMPQLDSCIHCLSKLCDGNCRQINL